MSERIVLLSQPNKLFHQRNSSDELDVFEATSYFSGATENFSDAQKHTNSETGICGDNTQKCNMGSIRRTSLDMPKNRGNPIPLQSMLIESPKMVNKVKEKKFKPPSSPRGKLAHFLNSLFNQTSSKKSKSKEKSTKDEDESPSGWKRKRRSSISHLIMNGNPNSAAATTAARTATIATGMPPSYHVVHTPTKTTSYGILGSHSCLKPLPSQVSRTPITDNIDKIENFDKKSDFLAKSMTFRDGFVEKVMIFNGEQEEVHSYKHVSREEIKEFKKFIDEDDGTESDSSSDLFELTNCDLGHYSSGLPVYETTHMDGIKIGNEAIVN